MARRENGGGYKEMTAYQRKGYKKVKRSKDLGSEKEIVQKTPGTYSSRYKGLVSPEKDIVDEYYSPTYDSRYN